MMTSATGQVSTCCFNYDVQILEMSFASWNLGLFFFLFDVITDLQGGSDSIVSLVSWISPSQHTMNANLFQKAYFHSFAIQFLPQKRKICMFLFCFSLCICLEALPFFLFSHLQKLYIFRGIFRSVPIIQKHWEIIFTLQRLPVSFNNIKLKY